MNPQLAQYMLLGMAALARIEGMKAENRKREMDGHAPAYSEIDFFNEAESLEVLAIQAINTSGG